MLAERLRVDWLRRMATDGDMTRQRLLGTTGLGPGLIDRADRLSRSATGAVAALGILGMLLVGIATLVDVLVLRTLFNAPLPGFNEVLQTAFAVAIASVLASGLATRAVVRVDVLAGWLGLLDDEDEDADEGAEG